MQHVLAFEIFFSPYFANCGLTKGYFRELPEGKGARVFGDLHGHFLDIHLQVMKWVEEEYRPAAKNVDGHLIHPSSVSKLVFLGDYFDRGAHNLLTFLYVLSLKYDSGLVKS